MFPWIVPYVSYYHCSHIIDVSNHSHTIGCRYSPMFPEILPYERGSCWDAWWPLGRTGRVAWGILETLSENLDHFSFLFQSVWWKFDGDLWTSIRTAHVFMFEKWSTYGLRLQANVHDIDIMCMGNGIDKTEIPTVFMFFDGMLWRKKNRMFFRWNQWDWMGYVSHQHDIWAVRTMVYTPKQQVSTWGTWSFNELEFQVAYFQEENTYMIFLEGCFCTYIKM